MPPQQTYQNINVVNFPDDDSNEKLQKDMEYIEPAFDSTLRRTNFIPATFNLVATIVSLFCFIIFLIITFFLIFLFKNIKVGGGVLSLPLAFAKAGIIPSILLMIFAAVITDFSLYIICSCARRTNPGATSYMEIVKYAFGPGAEIATTSILVTYLSGVLVGFCVLLKGIFAPLVKDVLDLMGGSLGGIQETDKFDAIILFIILVLMAPLMIQRNLYALRNICYVGFSSVCFIAITIGIRAYQRNFVDAKAENIDFKIKWMANSWDDILFAFPVIVLAFLCAFNMVEVHTVS